MFSTLKKRYNDFRIERGRFLSFVGWLQGKLLVNQTVWVESISPRDAELYSITKKSIQREHSVRDSSDFLIIHQPSIILSDQLQTAKYSLLFQTPLLEIWEHRSVTKSAPFRLGIPREEKQHLLSTARTLLQLYLETGQIPNDTLVLNEERYNKPYGVDIGLWTRGHNRGSIISFEDTFKASFLKALWGAATDQRYKPLTLEELPHTKIEISLLSDLHIPICKNEVTTEAIYSNLGYVALRDSVPQGWYLPMVCNARTFSSHTQFIQSLVHDKAKIIPENIPKTSISVFTVHNFIDTAKNNSVLELDGPLPAPQNGASVITQDTLKKICNDAVDWLIQNTSSEGYLAPIIYADTERPFTLDSARTVFTAYALNVYSTETKHTEGQEAAGKIIRFYEQSVRPHEKAESLASTYYAHYLLSNTESRSSPPTISNTFNLEKGGTIHRLQKIHLAQMQGLTDANSAIDYLLNELFTKIDANSEVSLAEYAELLVVTHAAKHPDHAKLCQWYLSRQHACGSFPNTTQNSQAYTRGTGKIIEALAFTGEHTSEIHRALHWLSRFQYTKDTLYCIPEEKQARFVGSLRHDACNRDTWVDSVGHLLLCVARLIQSERALYAQVRTLPQQMS